MTYQLSAADQATIEHTTAAAVCAGPEAVASAITIHVRALTHGREDLRLLLVKVEQRRRSIAMREEALRLLRAEP